MTAAAELGPDAARRPRVLFVCTGNAARSVMGAALLRSMSDAIEVAGAGTHSIPGLPMSVRTRTVLEELSAPDPEHRSAQVDSAAVAGSAMIVIFEPMHLRWMRTHLPQTSSRVASLPRFVRDLPTGSSVEDLADRVESMDLADHEFEDWEEVVDPAGGDLETFRRCGSEISRLVLDLAGRLGVGDDT